MHEDHEMRLAITVLALTLTAVTAVTAQSKLQTRDGFTISFGLGLGSVGVSCNGCTTDRENAPSGYLRVSGAVRPNLVVAAESQFWNKETTDQRTTENITAGALLGVAQWYPEPAGGFYVKAGVGVGSLSDDITDPVFNAKVESTGLALNFGAGFDYRMGKNFSLTPFVNYTAMTGGKAKVNGASTSEKLNGNLFQVGLGFTWH
jgi:outer membrane protein with beta-barrel domain